MKSENPDPNNKPFSFLAFWSTTLSSVLAVGVLAYLGYLLDERLHLAFPIFTLLAIFAGLIGAVYILLRKSKK